MKLYVSIKPKHMGGGSNSFAMNFALWARKKGHKVVKSLLDADLAVIIAHFGEPAELKEARVKGVRLIHRIDEYFSKNEDEVRRIKHNKIKGLNRYCHVTVFQSAFVRDNVYPHLKPEKYMVVINGTDPSFFHPAKKPGRYIGHCTWSIGASKRLDWLLELIMRKPDEPFLLVGRHELSGFDFRLPNVKMVGPRSRRKIARLYRKMKLLVHPAENDPCSNTLIEAIVSGVPVCYNTPGGGSEIARNCGADISKFEEVLANLDEYRKRCLGREDLYFKNVIKKYLKAGMA